MVEEVREVLELATGLIELFAVAVIIGGFIRAAVSYTRVLQAEDRAAAFHVFRGKLGMDLLLGLEILVVGRDEPGLVPRQEAVRFLPTAEPLSAGALAIWVWRQRLPTGSCLPTPTVDPNRIGRACCWNHWTARRWSAAAFDSTSGAIAGR